MKILIDIPEKDVPKRQEIMTIDLYFIDGTVCASSYPCEELPKGHGKLVDMNKVHLALDEFMYNIDGVHEFLDDEVTTIIEEDGGDI